MSYFFLILNKLFKKFMMKKITLFITALIFALNSYAQNDLWPTDPINTGSNSTYLVQDVSFNNGNLVYGILGAFFTNDSWILFH